MEVEWKTMVLAVVQLWIESRCVEPVGGRDKTEPSNVQLVSNGRPGVRVRGAGLLKFHHGVQEIWRIDVVKAKGFIAT